MEEFKMKAIISRTIFLFVFVMLCAGNSWSQTPEQLFQKGIMKEEGEGSLREAIELYKSVADNAQADRVLRAKALYQMGNCYEKLGQQEARGVYEKLVANYTDPADLVANAKRKLNNLNTGQTDLTKPGLSMRQVKDASVLDWSYSPDGKYVAYYDSDSDALGVRNLQTGEKWIVSPKDKITPSKSQYVSDPIIWSPDSKSLVFRWVIRDNTFSTNSEELHLVEKDGSQDRIIAKNTAEYYPQDWSSDGRSILCIRSGDTNWLSLITVKDGKEKEIANLGGRWTAGAQFSNDGNFVVFSAQKEEKSENYDIYTVPLNGGVAQELVSFKEKDEGPVVIRGTNKVVFISSHTGEKDLWVLHMENGKLKGDPEILKSGLDLTSWINGVLDNGTVLISTFRWNPEFFYAKLDVERNDVTFFPFDIPRGSIKMVKTAWSPSLSKVAVMAADPKSYAGLTKMNFIVFDLRTRERQEVPTDLYAFPVQDWIEPQWTPDEKSVLIKAERIEGSRLPGGIYKVDFSTHITSEYMMLGKSWTAFKWKWRWLQFSPDGKTQYFASTDDDFKLPMKLFARSAETGSEQIIRQFDKMPGKFFLSPDGNLIAVKYDNSLLVFNADGSNEKIILKDLDKNWGTLLGWANDSKSVLVQRPVDKKNWAIWIQPLDGKEYREVISADKLKPFFGASGLMLHYVGNETYLSMQNGERIYELWAVENIVQK